ERDGGAGTGTRPDEGRPLARSPRVADSGGSGGPHRGHRRARAGGDDRAPDRPGLWPLGTGAPGDAIHAAGLLHEGDRSRALPVTVHRAGALPGDLREGGRPEPPRAGRPGLLPALPTDGAGRRAPGSERLVCRAGRGCEQHSALSNASTAAPPWLGSTGKADTRPLAERQWSANRSTRRWPWEGSPTRECYDEATD